MKSINKFLTILSYAYKNVPYYNYLFNKYKIDITQFQSISDLKKLPILLKKYIFENPRKFISTEFKINELDQEHTSGSTGIPLYLYKTKKEKYILGFTLWKYRKKFNIFPNDKHIRFHISLRKNHKISTPFSFKRNNYLSLSLLYLQKKNIEKYLKLIFDFKPKWIFGSPSAVSLLANYIILKNINYLNNIKLIELTGEYLNELNRNIIYEAFNCPILNHYGCREIYAIGYECQNKKLHILEDNMIIEILNIDDKTKLGDIYITSLINYAMPLIRYELGDRGRILNNYICTCGNKNKIIQLDFSRKSENIKLSNNEVLNSSVFHYIIKKINLKGYRILQFQVIQNKVNYFLVNLFGNFHSNEYKNNIKKIFFKEAKNFGLYNNFFKFNFSKESLINYKTGKIKPFIQNIK